MADVVPAVGRFVQAATGMVAYLLAAVLTLSVVAVAWLYHRPALAVTLLVLAGVALAASAVGIAKVLKRNRQRAPAPEPAQ